MDHLLTRDVAYAKLAILFIGLVIFLATIPTVYAQSTNLTSSDQNNATGKPSPTPPLTAPSTRNSTPLQLRVTLDPISDVQPSQQSTVTGSLDSGSNGVGGQSITLDGNGVIDPSCSSTKDDGSFSCTFTAPNTVDTQWQVKAHFGGIAASSEFGLASSDSNVVPYNTIGSTAPPALIPQLPPLTPAPTTQTPLINTSATNTSATTPTGANAPLPPMPIGAILAFVTGIVVVVLVIFGLYKAVQKIRGRHRMDHEGPTVNVDVEGGISS